MLETKFEIEFAGENFDFRSHRQKNVNAIETDDTVHFQDTSGQSINVLTKIITGNKRYYQITTNKCLLHDFVIRFTIRNNADLINFNGRTFRHENSNKCYEAVGNSIIFKMNNQTIRIGLNLISTTVGIEAFNYIRDEPTGLWIMHFRIKPNPKKIDHYHLRILSRIFTGNLIPNITLSRLFGRLIFRVAPNLLDYRERYGKGNFQLTGYKNFGRSLELEVVFND